MSSSQLTFIFFRGVAKNHQPEQFGYTPLYPVVSTFPITITKSRDHQKNCRVFSHCENCCDEWNQRNPMISVIFQRFDWYIPYCHIILYYTILFGWVLVGFIAYSTLDLPRSNLVPLHQCLRRAASSRRLSSNGCYTKVNWTGFVGKILQENHGKTHI